ncbi:MAG: hypothetical protein FVQ82_10965 [Planctomycetes bacterium]|nr:hypothetical protein [Planctomycetota bacterium]
MRLNVSQRWVFMAALLVSSVLAGQIAAAEINVKASRNVYVGKLKSGSLIHGNREYTYTNIPKPVQGMEYTLHDHKASSQLKSADKWGSILIAEKISGLKPVDKSLARTRQPKKQKKNYPNTEFGNLQMQIAQSKTWNMPRLEKEALRKDALILATDKTPIDIVLRRTAVLLKHLRTMPNGPALNNEEKALNALKTQCTPEISDEQTAKLFPKITALRRKIAFQNPLLDFDKIAFIKHHGQGRFGHMVDQYLGFNQPKGGGLYVLENPFSNKAKVKSLLADVKVASGRLKGKTIEDNGSFMSLELDYDAKTVYFAFTEAVTTNVEVKDRVCDDPVEGFKNKYEGQFKWYYWAADRVFHIYKADLAEDGTASNLRQITFGKYNDFDPCVLPNGRLAFISGRIGGNQRCGDRMCSTYTLHGMMNDGSDIIPFSYHDTNEWHPSVDNNGMIVYSRWDYVDRDSDIAHHIWHTFPDGRDPRSYHGNYPKVRESRPWMELAIRAIPNSRRYVAVSAPHHGFNYGSLVMIDISKKDDASTSQLKRITPEAHFPESEAAPGVMHGKGTHRPRGEVYGQPWALSEDFYLCVYSTSQRNHGVYLVDSFGNKELLYQDPKIGCLDPMPLRSRKRPPVIPVRTQQAKADRFDSNEKLAYGIVTIMNIYEGEYDWPKDTKIKELRIINVFSKPNFWMDKPRIGVPAQSLARGILGTVPVEEDGSVHFKCPTGMPIYFQALDEKGMMVQNMRSATYVHPGETLSCIGCHESKQDTPKNTGTPIALKRGPSKIKPEATGSFPLTFPRLVQPVLDAKCVSCHDKEEKAKSLRGDKFAKHGWSQAFATLERYAWGKSGGNGAIRQNKRSYSIPGQEGFRVSGLYKMLVANDHYGVKLTKDQLRRISAWVDCNSNFYGAYYDKEKQAAGEIVKPLLSLPRLVPFENLRR